MNNEPIKAVETDEDDLDALSTPGEKETWDWMAKLFDDLRKAREDQWGEDYDPNDTRKFYWGDQYDVHLPSFKLPIVVNEAKTYILSEVSDLTDNPIKVYVQKDRSKGDRDEKVEQAIQAEWTNRNVDLEVMKAARDSLTMPGAFFGCFVKEERTGEKVLDVRALDPTCVYPDGDCTSDENWNHVGYEEIQDLVKIRADYPERGWRVKPEDAFSVKAPNASPWYQFWKRWGHSSYKGPLSSAGTATRITGYVKARAAVLHLWIYDDAVEEVPEVKKDEQGNPVVDEQGQQILTITTKKVYPNGRHIVAANGVVLYDDQYEFLGPFPIIRVLAEPDTHSFWLDKSPLDGVKALFQAANKMESLVVENAIRLNSGLVIADADSGLKPGQLANMPGQVLLKRSGTQVQVVPPPQFPESFTKIGQMFRDMGARVLGWSQARLGAGNRGNVSAELTETEISQAMGLTRLRARLLHHACSKLVTQMFLRMAQYYTLPRAMPMVSSASWHTVDWTPVLKPEDYAVHVDPASFMLRSKTMLQRLTLQLSKMKLVSPEYTLKTLEMPDAVEEAKKGQQAQQLAVAAHEAAKAQQKAKK